MNLKDEALQQIEELQRENMQLKEKLQMVNKELQLLKFNEDKFQNLVEASPNGFILVDTQGIIMLVNKKTESMFGYTRDELLGKKVEILIPMAHRHNHEHYRDEFAQKPATRSMGAGRDLFGLHKNGSLIPVEIGLNPLTTSEGTFVIASIIDITKRKQDEAALRESEERLKIVLQNMPAMMRAFDMEGNLVVWNTECVKITGYSADEMIGNPDPMNLLFPDPEYREQIRRDWYGNGGDYYNKEWKIRNKDGTFRFVSWSNISGKLPVPGWSSWSIGLDVTEQKKAEKALRESEQRLQAIFDNAAIGIAEVDKEERFVVLNNRICHILGYTREELLGKSVYDITLPEDVPSSIEMNKKIYDGELDVVDYEKRYIKKDGSLLWVHVSVSAVHDVLGNHINSIHTIEDIAVRKKVEEELKESEEKFRSLFENITEGVALHEIVYQNDTPVNYRIVDVNPAYENYYGIPHMAGNLATDVFKANEPPHFKEYLEVALSGRPYRFESVFEGVNKHFMISVISPKKGQFATVFEDITEHKKNEQEIKQKNEELTRFIYTVSHDLKSPLVTIKSFTSYLKEDIESNDKAAQEKDISYIQNAADKMSKLLDELLELSRIGKKEIPKTEIPLETIAQAAIDLVAGRIRNREAKVSITGPPVMLYGYEQRLIQLYQNLIDNAVKFMGEQPDPLIEIGSYLNKNKNMVILYVKDNGLGIDPKYHHKLFGLFEKLDNKSEGTGIGLALIKRIAEVHNGAVCLDSEGEGKGTAFYFTLDKTYVLEES